MQTREMLHMLIEHETSEYDKFEEVCDGLARIAARKQLGDLVGALTPKKMKNNRFFK
jgi:hypothetical protein